MTSWIRHMLRNDKILITFHMSENTQKFTRDLTYAHVSEEQAYSMGYQRGIRILDEFRYIFFKTYVKFIPDISPGYYTYTDADGNVIECRESSSTLYDHWRSDTQEKFMAGMTTKTSLSPSQLKQLGMIGIIVAAAAVGVLLLVRRCRSSGRLRSRPSIICPRSTAKSLT